MFENEANFLNRPSTANVGHIKKIHNAIFLVWLATWGFSLAIMATIVYVIVKYGPVLVNAIINFLNNS